MEGTMIGRRSRRPSNVTSPPVLDSTALDRWIAQFANRDEMADAYRRVIVNRGPGWPGYAALNLAIIDRWSLSGLNYIKEKAWRSSRGERRG
jgi:hypothetical protein